VFVDADDAFLAEAVAAARLDAIQLHGHEAPDRAAQVRARFGLPVWKVLSVATAADVARAGAYAGTADFILFDAKTPKGAACPADWVWRSTGRCWPATAARCRGASPAACRRTTWPRRSA
jgi:phosphoribosylanthranilate isomerase